MPAFTGMTIDKEDSMKLARMVIVTAAAGVALSALPSYAQQKVSLRFGTVGLGSAWYNYGAGIADMVKPQLPAGSSIDVLPRAGGVGGWNGHRPSILYALKRPDRR